MERLMLPFYVVIFTACVTQGRVAGSPVILVSLDGLGWQFPGGKFAKTPNLDFMAKTGVTAKYMKTISPAVTWPNHQTYMTGLYAESHGIVANRFWDPVYKETFVIAYDTSVCPSNDVPKFWNNSEPLWLTMENNNIKTALYNWPGFFSYNTKPTYYKEMSRCYQNCSSTKEPLPLGQGKRNPKYCFPNYTESYHERIDKVVGWLTSDAPPKFVAMKIEQPDRAGHAFGPQSDMFKKAIEHVDKNAVGYLKEALEKKGLLDKVNLIIVADHNFASINKSRLIFYNDFLDPSTYRVIESAMVNGQIWPNPGKFDEVYTNLTTLMAKRFPQVNIYKREDIPDEWHLKHNRRVPPIFVDPGYGWFLIPSGRFTNIPDDWVIGAHGYPAGEHMGAIFYARGPAFKKGYKADRVLDSVDVYPLMCKILGLEPRPNNGSIGNMVDLMAKDVPSGVEQVVSFVFIVTFCFFLVQIV